MSPLSGWCSPVCAPARPEWVAGGPSGGGFRGAGIAHAPAVNFIIPLGLAILGLGLPVIASQDAVPASSTAEPVVQRFLSRADEPLTRYRAFRRLEARNARFKLHGWLEAWTELTPSGQFKFEIVCEGGSDYIRNKVLRPVLENEEKLFATREASRSAMTSENYHLRGTEAAEPGHVKLLVKPKRREVS